MNNGQFFMPGSYNFYNQLASRHLNQMNNMNQYSMQANRVQMPRVNNNIKQMPIPIKVKVPIAVRVPVPVKQVKVRAVPIPIPVHVDRAVPIPIKVPIPVKIPVPIHSQYHSIYQQKPTQSPQGYKPSMHNQFFSSGSVKNGFNIPDPLKTSTFRSQHGFHNQFFSPHPFYSPAPNVQNSFNSPDPRQLNKSDNFRSSVFNAFQQQQQHQQQQHQQQQQQQQSLNMSSQLSRGTLQASQILKEMQKQVPSNLQKHLQNQMSRQGSSGNILNNMIGMLDNIQKYYPHMQAQNQRSSIPETSNVPAAPVTTTIYEPAYSNRYPTDEKLVAASNSIQLVKAIEEPKKESLEKSKDISYSDLFQKISDSNKLNEDIRSKIDYLYQSSMPKKSLKKSLTYSPIVNFMDGYECLDECTEKVKSQEFVIDNSNKNISMINSTIKDINHKIKKLKRTSRTRS